MALERLKDWCGRASFLRRLYPTGAPVVVVLMYHDLRRDDDFPNWLRVAESDFAAQLDACAELGDFIAPQDLFAPERLSRDRFSFLVTFDDGYRNNAELAAPLLAERRIPALFFVSTGPLTSQQPFWTDVVVTPIQALRLRSLDLSDRGFGRFAFRAGGEAARWDDIQRLLTAIKAVGNEDHPQVAGLLGWLQEEYGAVLAEHLPRLRPLTADEVRWMAAERWCHFGSHGHDHRILTRLTDAELAHSLAYSRAILSDLTGQPCEHLAYPNGDHDARILAAAATAGYRGGYTIRSGLVAGRVPALTLPRLAVGGFDTPARLRFNLARTLLALRRGRASEQFELVGAPAH